MYLNKVMVGLVEDESAKQDDTNPSKQTICLVCRRPPRNMCRHVCIDMCIVMYVDTCIDMFIDTCINGVQMCV